MLWYALILALSFAGPWILAPPILVCCVGVPPAQGPSLPCPGFLRRGVLLNTGKIWDLQFWKNENWNTLKVGNWKLPANEEFNNWNLKVEDYIIHVVIIGLVFNLSSLGKIQFFNVQFMSIVNSSNLQVSSYCVASPAFDFQFQLFNFQFLNSFSFLLLKKSSALVYRSLA